MSLNTYDIGDLIRISIPIVVDGEPTDPTTLRARVKDPDGAETIYVYGEDAELARADEGDYHLDVSASMSGTWRYRVESTGTAEGAEEGAFFVRTSAFA